MHVGITGHKFVGPFVRAQYSGKNLSKASALIEFTKTYKISTQNQKERMMTSKNLDELCEN